MAVGPSWASPRVEGQLFDRDANGLGGVTVQVVHEKNVRMPWDDKDRVTVLAQTRTDRMGMFELAFDAPEKGKISLRCVETAPAGQAGGWDHRRYAFPQPRDITAEIRELGRAIVSFAVNDAPGWAEIAQAIERVGGLDSKKGMVLRSHGTPPERLVTRQGRNEWRYESVIYVFEGETLVRTQPRTGADVAQQSVVNP